MAQTGAGKTPLGEFLEQTGLWNARCVHFDFGENLRKISKVGQPTHFLTKTDINLTTRRLEENALFEDNELHIAKGVLFTFIEKQQIGPDEFIILNGIPRHIGQAHYVDTFVNIKLVIHLNTHPEVVVKRIKLNTGGDRSGRPDDSIEEVRRRLIIFEQRTMPVIEHYQNKQVDIQKINIKVDTTPMDIKNQITNFK